MSTTMIHDGRLAAVSACCVALLVGAGCSSSRSVSRDADVGPDADEQELVDAEVDDDADLDVDVQERRRWTYLYGVFDSTDAWLVDVEVADDGAIALVGGAFARDLSTRGRVVVLEADGSERWEWFFDDESGRSAVQAAAFTETGELWVTASCYGEVTLGECDAGDDCSFSCGDKFDALLLRFDESGGVQDVVHFDLPNSQGGYGITIDDSGELVVSGTYEGETDFDPEHDGGELESLGGTGHFLLRLDADGRYLAAHRYRVGGWASYHDFDVRPDGTAVVAGGFSFEAHFDVDGEEQTWVPEGIEDGYIQTFDAEGHGDGLWIVRSERSDDVRSASPHPGGGLVAIAESYGELELLPESNGVTCGLPVEWSDFLVSIDAAGTVESCLVLSSNLDLLAFSPATLTVGDTGTIYISGSFRGTVDFDPGPGEALRTWSDDLHLDQFVYSLDADGRFRWVNTYSPNLGSSGSFDGWGIVEVPEGGVLFWGGLDSATVDFDPGPGEDLREVTHRRGFVSFLPPNGVRGE